MGSDSVLELIVVSDIHKEFLGWDPIPTIDRVLSSTTGDLFVNLGDNSGDASRVLELANKHNLPYLSVLGNHDIIELNINSVNLSKRKKFFSQEIEKREIKKIRKNGYGLFNNGEMKIKPISDYRMYYTIIDTENGNVGVIFRHFPFYFERASDMEYATRLIYSFELTTLYIVSGHLHSSNLNIEGKQKDIKVSNKEVPIFGVVLPPFTKGEQDFYAGIYKLSFLSNGVLKINELYLKNNTFKSKSFGKIDEVANYGMEIARGELLVRA